MHCKHLDNIRKSMELKSERDIFWVSMGEMDDDISMRSHAQDAFQFWVEKESSKMSASTREAFINVSKRTVVTLVKDGGIVDVGYRFFVSFLCGQGEEDAVRFICVPFPLMQRIYLLGFFFPRETIFQQKKMNNGRMQFTVYGSRLFGPSNYDGQHDRDHASYHMGQAISPVEHTEDNDALVNKGTRTKFKINKKRKTKSSKRNRDDADSTDEEERKDAQEDIRTKHRHQEEGDRRDVCTRIQVDVTSAESYTKPDHAYPTNGVANHISFYDTRDRSNFTSPIAIPYIVDRIYRLTTLFIHAEVLWKSKAMHYHTHDVYLQKMSAAMDASNHEIVSNVDTVALGLMICVAASHSPDLLYWIMRAWVICSHHVNTRYALELANKKDASILHVEEMDATHFLEMSEMCLRNMANTYRSARRMKQSGPKSFLPSNDTIKNACLVMKKRYVDRLEKGDIVSFWSSTKEVIKDQEKYTRNENRSKGSTSTTLDREDHKNGLGTSDSKRFYDFFGQEMDSEFKVDFHGTFRSEFHIDMHEKVYRVE